MDWSTYLDMIIKLVIIPLLGVLSTFLVKFIQKKSDEAIARTDSEVLARYIRMAQDTVSMCVVATNQTFVDVLKNKGTFTKEAAEEAFRRTKDAVLDILSQDAIEYLTTAVGDLDVYLDSLIEAQVKVNKTVTNVGSVVPAEPEPIIIAEPTVIYPEPPAEEEPKG